MNPKDQEAFFNWQCRYSLMEEVTLGEAWQAALSHERQRSAKLVEALEKIAGRYQPLESNKNLIYTAEGAGLFASASAYRIELAKTALKEYYASGEGER